MIQNLTLKYAIIASLIIGFMFTLCFGTYGYSYYEIYRHSLPVYGYVEDINLDKGTTTVSYSTDESTYKSTIHFIDSGLKNGDRTTVYYDTRNPSKSFIYEQATILLFFFGVGVVFLILAVILMFVKTIKEKNPKKKPIKKRRVK
jgi:hypothetical protein